MNSEAIDVLQQIAKETTVRVKSESNEAVRSRLKQEVAEMAESISQLSDVSSDEGTDGSPLSWENVSSLSSLAEVAWLYCRIPVSKEIRDDFMKLGPEEIRADLDTYLTYCAKDVQSTHSVYSKVLPLFLEHCPHPVSFAGILTMGSSFLPVNETWDEYISKAEKTYRTSEAAVISALRELAVTARDLMGTGRWKNDPWLQQLDWSPKKPRASRLEGFAVPDIVPFPEAGVWGRASNGSYVVPTWLHRIASSAVAHTPPIIRDLSIVLGLTFESHPLRWTSEHGWARRVPQGESDIEASSRDDTLQEPPARDFALPDPNLPVWVPLLRSKPDVPFGDAFQDAVKAGNIKSSLLSKTEIRRLTELDASPPEFFDKILRIVAKLVTKSWAKSRSTFRLNPELTLISSSKPEYEELDWTPVVLESCPSYLSPSPKPSLPKNASVPDITWPKWYFDLAAPKSGKAPGILDLTPRTRVSSLLLRLSWRGFPLFHSREHGWTFRVDPKSLVLLVSRQKAVSFTQEADLALKRDIEEGGYAFFKLPHKDGEEANVGSPLSKIFLPYANDGTLSSPNELASKALLMNAECSYWISARERIMTQMVVRNMPGKVDLGIARSDDHNWGMIIPQMVTMGTVTRRAMERTWLTASNAKKNRVGSELKAMVRAPPGYAIVGADVDSEELWISSVMGDSQFGLHGASALGWMTLEGTKSAGTDLHSKTAKILGINRDQAKIFNYSRIYGAGKKHAELLLLQSNPSLSQQDARSLANDLYASTKGKKSSRRNLAFHKTFWHGGTESFVFNRLEEVATSLTPKTPALGCGITAALTQEHLTDPLSSDFMPSRINWVVQSSGVDYLHLLIVSMEYLITLYGIKARYLISVHDEIRYLVRDEDKYRLALALQIANLWTRSQFVYRLGFDNLPQGVAFFSAVDIDHVLRKEVDMPCTTPSQSIPIPPGESLDIYRLIERLGSRSLGKEVGGALIARDGGGLVGSMRGYRDHDSLEYRSQSPEWLQAQATKESAEVQALWKRIKPQSSDGTRMQAM